MSVREAINDLRQSQRLESYGHILHNVYSPEIFVEGVPKSDEFLASSTLSKSRETTPLLMKIIYSQDMYSNEAFNKTELDFSWRK